MLQIGYVGFGDLGRQIQAFVHEAWGDSHHEVFFDDKLAEEGAPNSFAFSAYSWEEFEGYEFLVSLGYKHLTKRLEIYAHLKKLGRRLPCLIHPTAYVHPQAKLDDGVIIYPHCVVDKGAIIEDGVLLNNAVVISHESVIGRCCFLAPCVCISGFCKVGACSFLGAGTVAADGISVGEGCTIGVGTILTHDVPPATSCIGNPMRLLSHPLSLDRTRP